MNLYFLKFFIPIIIIFVVEIYSLFTVFIAHIVFQINMLCKIQKQIIELALRINLLQIHVYVSNVRNCILYVIGAKNRYLIAVKSSDSYFI